MIAGLVLCTGMFFCSSSQAGEPSLTVVSAAKDIAAVELVNEVPVRALQFELAGVKITQVLTTERTKGFMTKFNEENGKVILLSTAGDEIVPGKGAVLKISCDKPDAAVLSGVRIVEK